MNLRDSENTWVLGIFLGITALVAALLLTLVSDWTAGPIKAAQENTRNLMLKRLHLNEFDKTGSSIVKNGISFCAVYNKGKCAGFVGQGSNRLGYGGEIEIMVGFTLDGRITAVQILRHHETPGLGANVCDRKFQRTILNLSAEAPEVPENIYLDQFNGKEAAKSGDWKIVKDNGEFIYRTGATVTARAVTALVNDIAAEFAKNRAEIQEKSVL